MIVSSKSRSLGDDLSIPAPWDFSLRQLWGFYLTGFRVSTIAALAAAGLFAALGLLRLKPWGLWLSYALYLPQVVQASMLLWSLTLLEDFPAGPYGELLQIGLCAYLILITLSLLLSGGTEESFSDDAIF